MRDDTQPSVSTQVQSWASERSEFYDWEGGRANCEALYRTVEGVSWAVQGSWEHIGQRPSRVQSRSTGRLSLDAGAKSGVPGLPNKLIPVSHCSGQELSRRSISSGLKGCFFFFFCEGRGCLSKYWRQANRLSVGSTKEGCNRRCSEKRQRGGRWETKKVGPVVCVSAE